MAFECIDLHASLADDHTGELHWISFSFLKYIKISLNPVLEEDCICSAFLFYLARVSGLRGIMNPSGCCHP